MDFLFSSKKRDEKKAAEELLAAGDAEGAWRIFQRLEHKAGLAAVGEHLLAKGNLRRAAEAFAAAGQDNGVRRAAEIWLERGHYNEWIKTLKLGGLEAAPAEHARAGRLLLEKGDFHGAEKAFAAAADSDGLRTLAGRYLEKNDLDNAARLLRKLGAPAELAPLAERHLQRGDLDKAAKLFAEAGDEAGLQRVAGQRAARAAATPPRHSHAEDFDPEDPHRPV